MAPDIVRERSRARTTENQEAYVTVPVSGVFPEFVTVGLVDLESVRSVTVCDVAADSIRIRSLGDLESGQVLVRGV